jgi:hypothetical protein
MLYRGEQKGITSRRGQSARWALIGILTLLGVASGRGGTLGTSMAIVEALTLDQSFTAVPTGTLLIALINACCRFVAQTFTAGLTGTLGGVNIDVQSRSIFPLHVAIRTVIDGVPSTTVLGETTLSSSSAPLSLLITFPQVIPIVAGVQYAIVVNYEGAPPPGGSQIQGAWLGAVGDQYPRGQLYSSFLDGISWFLSDGLDGFDVHFQTYVNPAIEVDIDIKPGEFPNSINPKSQGVIPVAILTTDTFDATTVDPSTVIFGATGTEAAAVQSALEDVDGDGFNDLILHFNTQDTGIQCGDTSALLTGQTFSGQAIEGSDSIVTVGCK